MLDPKTNSNRRQSSTFMETLQDKLKDIKNFSNWSAKEQMVAVTAVGVIFGALFPVVAVALPVAAAGAAVALTLFFAVKAVEYGYKGLKWSAEKTWEGARYTAGKIKAGAVYAKDSVKKGYENSVDSLKRGSGKVKSAIGSALKTVGHKISSTGEDMNISYKLTDFTDTGVLLLTEDGKKEYNSIRNALRNISDKHLLEKISSEMVSLIDSKIESEKNMIDFQNKGNLHKSEALISRWIKQKNSIVELDPKGLQKRLSYEGYDRDLYQIFSEHHSEIKGIIKDESTRFKAIDNLNKAAEAYLRMNGPGSTPPSLSRSSSMDSLNSVRTNSTVDSTAGLLNPEEHKKAPTSPWNRLSLLFKGNKASEGATGVKYQPLSGPDATQLAEIGTGDSPVVPPKAPESPTSDYASERSSPNPSGPSTPTGRQSPINFASPTPVMLTDKGGRVKTQDDLKKTGRLDKLVGQPSTEIDVDTDVQRQTIPKTV